MKANKIFIFAICIMAVLAIIGATAFSLTNTEQKSSSLTVYSDVALVNEYTQLQLKSGLNDLSYEVAAQIIPESVYLKAEGVNILEQNYNYDVVSKDKLLEKYLNKQITVYRNNGNTKEAITGTLISYDSGSIIIQDASGNIQILNSQDISLPSLNEELTLKPTLKWLVESDTAKTADVELSYLTNGMSWTANYVAVVDDKSSKIDLNSWVNIQNNAGKDFSNVNLKLVAGQLNRVTNPYPVPVYKGGVGMETAVASRDNTQFNEQQFYEYHVYDLNRKTTLKNNENKQLSLFNINGITAEKEYVFDDSYSYYSYYDYSNNNQGKVKVMLDFKNTEANKMGIPLPQGTVKVFTKDASGALLFVGEDSIQHTAKDEDLRIFVGNAFDITAEKKQTDYQQYGSAYEYTYEVTIKNHKTENIKVSVIENVYGDWTILDSNYQYIKDSQNRIKFIIPVNADGESTLKYTIRYRY